MGLRSIGLPGFLVMGVVPYGVAFLAGCVSKLRICFPESWPYSPFADNRAKGAVTGRNGLQVANATLRYGSMVRWR